MSLEKTLEQIDWVKVEATRGEGAKQQIVGIFENTDFDIDEDELEDLETRDSKVVSEAARLLQIMLKGQDVALSRHGKEVAVAMDALVKVVGIQGKRLEHLEKVYASNVTMVQTMVRKLGGVGDDDVGGFSGEAIVGLLELFAGGKPKAPPNGAPAEDAG